MKNYYPLQLENGDIIQVETEFVKGKEDTSFGHGHFKIIKNAIEGVGATISESLAVLKPDKAVLELGVSFGVESGEIVPLLVKGASDSVLKITMEWNYAEQKY